jgi:hypothetical protein
MASDLGAAARLAKKDSPEEQIRRIVAEVLSEQPTPEPAKPTPDKYVIQQKRSASVLLKGVSTKLRFENANDPNYPTLLRMCIGG